MTIYKILERSSQSVITCNITRSLKLKRIIISIHLLISNRPTHIDLLLLKLEQYYNVKFVSFFERRLRYQEVRVKNVTAA